MTDPKVTGGTPGGDADREELPLTVLHSRSVSDLPLVQADLVGADSRAADLFLRFVEATAAAKNDETRLHDVITQFTFQVFAQATHLIIGLRDPVTDEIRPQVSRSREGGEPSIALSQTLTEEAMAKGMSLLFSPDPSKSKSESIVLSGIKTAITSPLSSFDAPFGVIQLDIRHPGKGRFTRKDVDRITVFAHHVGLVLDNLRLYQEQSRAFRSTINALVHSLSLKDPDTALHSERVQAISLIVGVHMGLRGQDLEALGVAAVLHDMGKQGIRDEVLLKPGKLTSGERDEMSQHAEHTQGVLDKIAYPAHLSEVPKIAAYHHEKMNGTGPYKIPGDQIPVQARIISAADVFDALHSARVYKRALPLSEVIDILEGGKGVEWDTDVVEAVKATARDILAAVYHRTPEEISQACGDRPGDQEAA